MKGKDKYTRTEHLHAKAVLRREELEEVMKSGNFSYCLHKELTAVYLINNINLIQSKN